MTCRRDAGAPGSTGPFIAFERVILFAAASVAAFSAAGASSACSDAAGTCDCADPGITIDVPADIASSVTAVTLSGTACTGVTPSVSNETNGGSEYRFDANAAGTCHIEVDSALGVYDDVVAIVAGPSCCTGFYPSPASAGQVQVPELGADAG